MNFAALKTAISAWLNRTDLAAQYPTFVTMAEERMLNGVPAMGLDPLRHHRMLKTSSLTTSGGTVMLPADCLELRSVSTASVSTTTAPVPWVDAEVWTDSDPWVETTETTSYGGATAPMGYAAPDVLTSGAMRGSNRVFSVADGKLILTKDGGPVAVTITYYARPATPAADADENWIMASAPGCYLYGSLIEAAVFLRDDGLTATARALYADAMGGLLAAGQREQWGGLTQLTIQAA